MDKWTVVVPTLWKSKYIHEQIKEYIWCRNIHEIILIDNSNEYFKYHKKIYNKINLIQPKENLFVNPSWNLGVEKSNTENIIIANDDILWDTSYLNQIKDDYFNDIDIIGQSPENYNLKISLSEIKEINKTDINLQKNIKKRPPAWGCLLFTKKTRWKNIPETLKIWYGDDWLINISSLKPAKIENMVIGGEINASEVSEFSKVRDDDRTTYNKLKKEHQKNK